MKKLNKMILSVMSFALSLVLITSGILYILFDEGVDMKNYGDEVIKRGQNDYLVEQEDFTNPKNKYRALEIVHDYMALKGEDYEAKAQNVIDKGFGGLITNDAWNAKYLQDEDQLQRINKIIKAAKDKGLRVWLYDEYGYPSGSAGDLVCKDNEDYKAVYLHQITVQGSGTGQQSVDIPENFVKVNSVSIMQEDKYVLADGVVENGKIKFNGVQGKWTAYIYSVVLYDHGRDGYSETYPNLLNKDAVKKFIDVTYQKYCDTVDDFPKIIEAFFTDEPQLCATRNIFTYDLKNPVIPYDYDIFETFKAKFGYDIVPLLPLVFNSQNDTAKRLRANFYSHVGDLISENYFGQITAWCKENGAMLSGHLLLEEQMYFHAPLYGDYMQCSNNMGAPGFDILGSRVTTYLEGGSTGAKYAASSAWLNNKERVFIEICPVDNAEDFPTNHLDYILGLMTFAYFDGGNQVASYYTQANAEIETGQAFNNYVSRLGSILVESQNKNEIAVYYGIDSVAGSYIAPETQSVWSADEFSKVNDKFVTDLTRGLRERGYDYVFVDNEAIEKATITEDALNIGEFNFKTVIVPRVSVLDIKVMRVFDALIEKGVNVIFAGALPTIAFMEQDQAELDTLAKKHNNNFAFDLNSVYSKITVERPFKATTTDATIYVSPYDLQGTKFFYLANASTVDAKVSFNYKGARAYRVYDALTGEITEVKDSYSIKSYRGIFVQPLI